MQRSVLISALLAFLVLAAHSSAIAQEAAFDAAAIVEAPIEPTAPLSLAGAFRAEAAAGASLEAEQTSPPPRATEYSDAYRLRAKIHRISSFATLPLFGAEAILGQSLYSDPSSSKKDAHLMVAGGIGALFGVNTVTGVWNLLEARKDPNKRGRRLTHGLLMLSADAGFLATAALGPESEHGESEGSRSTHRAVAFTSIGLASAGYLIMLFGGN
jgi:hypothetical protein